MSFISENNPQLPVIVYGTVAESFCTLTHQVMVVVEEEADTYSVYKSISVVVYMLKYISLQFQMWRVDCIFSGIACVVPSILMLVTEPVNGSRHFPYILTDNSYTSNQNSVIKIYIRKMEILLWFAQNQHYCLNCVMFSLK